MPAKVHSLLVTGQDDDFSHLYVIVIDIDGDQQLCIPAYDANGQKVNELVKQLHALGLYQGVGWVEFDNAKEVMFFGSRTGKLAKWVATKRIRVEKRMLGKPVGEMSDRGLKQIVECLLNLHAQRPDSTLTQAELRKAKQLAKALGATIPKCL